MNTTRYCSTCGSLLSEGAALCGECGARYQPSPYARRATDAPGAWSQAPHPRSRNRGTTERPTVPTEKIELISRDALDPQERRTPAPPSAEQYDRLMVTQPPLSQNGPGAPLGQPSGPGSPGPSPDSSAPAARTAVEMEAPLDGCVPASPVKRLVAALLDGVIATVLLIPLFVAIALLFVQDPITLFPQILSGIGVVIPAAYALLVVWLTGAKGFSFGKLIMGLRIARTSDGTRIGFLRAAGRWVLYGVIPWLMGLSIFLDPRSLLRGFHDRAVGSVVVDVKSGRDPFAKRADDYERADAGHYLGDRSVAVSTHENLLAAPGQAWTGAAQVDPDGRADPSDPADEHSAVDGRGGSAAHGASPFAPSTGSAPSDRSDSADGSAPSAGPVRSEHLVSSSSSAPEAPVDEWAPPRDEPAGQQRAGHPAPVAAPQPEQLWDQPQSPPHAWDQPYQEWGHPQQEDQPQHTPAVVQQPSAAPSWGVPTQDRPAAPDEQPGTDWDLQDHGVDEQTRLTPGEESFEDLEQTRVTAVPPPAVKKLRLTVDDGTEHLVEKTAVIGRNPAAADGADQLVMKDDTRSVSKTHLRLEDSGESITVTDLGSTNGSTILHEDGTRETLVPNVATILPPGDQLTLGDRTLSVEREQ